MYIYKGAADSFIKYPLADLFDVIRKMIHLRLSDDSE
ncbi:hypothetical protein Barb6_03216 [Bacteroidales bacterium Barb6]|nr:hypothetical protein Barb6_03216 [Bacteroidales bacterium Barb6]